MYDIGVNDMIRRGCRLHGILRGRMAVLYKVELKELHRMQHGSSTQTLRLKEWCLGFQINLQ